MPASAPLDPASEAPLFADGLGDRVVSTDPNTGELVQILRINPALTAVPSFEFALRERVARLANFRHSCYPRVRRVDRGRVHATSLSLVSDHIEGTRLSDILRVADERRLHLDLSAALCLVRQLVPAVALLHENARDAAHGLIALERLIVTPTGRLVVAEHVCGAAVEQMQFGRERLWHELRVAMPPSAGIPRFDQRSDVTATGAVALALVLGRPLRPDEFPRAVNELLASARERDARGHDIPLSAGLRGWLIGALNLDSRRAFANAIEAQAALDAVLADTPAYAPAPIALELFLSRYVSAILGPPVLLEAAPAAMAQPVTASTIAPPVAEASPAPQPHDASVSLFDPDAPFGSSDVSFDVEDAPMTGEPAPVTPAGLPPPARRGFRGWVLATAASVAVLGLGGFAALRVYTSTEVPALGTLSVQSNPSGVPVFVDGVGRGVTPVRLALPPGAHILELRRGVPRVIPVTLGAGAEVSQYLEFAEAPVPPLLLADPAPASEVVAPKPVETSGAPLAGWVTLRLPFVVEIREKGQLLGTSELDRLMLAAGTHELEFVNQALGYRVLRTVTVAAGRTAPITLDLPKGTVSVNAVPWAEVWLNGQRLGETPIGNLSVPIGAHEFVLRHPQLGEKRHAVSVTTAGPVRISLDMKSR